MPQQPPAFDPNEFGDNTPAFDPNEFGQKPAEPNWYDTAASYIPSPVKSAWNTLWEPMSDLPSRVMKPLAEAQYKYGESGSGLLNRLAMYGGAFDEAIGNTLSGMTSPGVIGTTLATGGTGLAARAGLPRVAQALAGAERVGGGLMAAQGATEVANPNASLMERGLGAINMVGGGLAARGARVPKGAGALEELPIKQSAAPIEVTPEAMPVRPPGKPLVESIQEMGLPPEQELAAYKGIIERNTPIKPEVPPEVPIIKEVTREPVTIPEKYDEFGNRIDDKYLDANVDPAAVFDPNTLQGLESSNKLKTYQNYRKAEIKAGRKPLSYNEWTNQSAPTPELEFLNPVTHEIRPASQAEPGDIPLPPAKEPTPINMLPPEANAEAPMPVRRAGKRMGAPNLGLSKPPASLRGTSNANEIRGYFSGKPKISTGELNPANVTESLAQRLEAETSGGGSKPPIKPPVTTGGEPPVPPTPPEPPMGLLTKNQLDPNIPIQGRKTPAPLPEQSKLSQIWNAPRSLQSVDLPGITSAALRQSRPLAFTRDWFKAWNSALKAYRSEDALKTINSKIENSKYFQPRYQAIINKEGEVIRYKEMPSVAEELGVRMTDVLNRREEAIASSLAEKIPGYGRYVKASNRAYTGFLNDLRAAKFGQLMDAAAAVGRENDLVLGKKIADFVNNATGRGSMKFFGNRLNLEYPSVVEILGDSLYSPRALSARLAFMNPHNYVQAEPLIRNEYWKSLARIGVSWGAFAGLASFLPRAKVSMDPTNADFGKIRIDNTRIDPGAGFQQLLVLTSREAAGGTTSSTGPAGKPGKFTKFGSSPMAPTMWSLPGRYIYNQMNPSLRFVADMLQATKKEPVDLTDRTLQLALPMYVTDIADAAKEDDAVAEFFAPLLSSTGTGVQTYERGSFNKPQVTPLIKKATGIDLPTVKVHR